MLNTEHYPKVYLYTRIVQAKLFIDQHYCEKIDINNIADKAFFSKFHFIRLFTKVYDKTPHQYLTLVRINKAKLLLQNGRPVSEVSVAVGFDSLSSFSGLFKKMLALMLPSITQNNRQSKNKVSSCRLNLYRVVLRHFILKTKNSNFEEVKS